ncbi:MAG TPA: hypothetical protein VNV85_03635 [Puia sp.]|nr:hypothetical protein [Puia sp.]
MPVIQKTASSAMKYKPKRRRLSGSKVLEKKDFVKVTYGSATDPLLQLNKIANGYPFCIMYHMTEHDPL